jgi:hypothetical protein
VTIYGEDLTAADIVLSDASGNGVPIASAGSEAHVESCKATATSGTGFCQTSAGTCLDGFLDEFITQDASLDAVHFSYSGGWRISRAHTYGTGGDAIHLGQPFSTVVEDCYIEDFGYLGIPGNYYHGIYGTFEEAAESRGLLVRDNHINGPEAMWQDDISYGLGQTAFLSGTWYTSLIQSNLDNTPTGSSDWSAISSPSTTTCPSFQYEAYTAPSGATDAHLQISGSIRHGPATPTNFGTALVLSASSPGADLYVSGDMGQYLDIHNGFAIGTGVIANLNLPGDLTVSAGITVSNATTIVSGMGAPTASRNAGDYYFRIDTPTISMQRLYVCRGSTSWSPIL